MCRWSIVAVQLGRLDREALAREWLAAAGSLHHSMGCPRRRVQQVFHLRMASQTKSRRRWGRTPFPLCIVRAATRYLAGAAEIKKPQLQQLQLCTDILTE